MRNAKAQRLALLRVVTRLDWAAENGYTAPLWVVGCVVAVAPVAALIGWLAGSRIAGIVALIAGTVVVAQLVATWRIRRGKRL